MSRPRVPKEWRSLLKRIPGYCPFSTAEIGQWFDVDEAAHALDFFAECLTLIEGEHAGKPFVLQEWQASIVANLFGWKKKDGTRRYREVFLYVPRKNGKTPFAAGLMLYVGHCDGEPGAQLYSAASERDQAALIFRHMSGMIEAEPELASRSRVYRSLKSIEFPQSGVFKSLSASADSKHGMGAHFVCLDELHAHKSSDLSDVLLTSTASRRQPIVLYTTTADIIRPSHCNEKYDYAKGVQTGTIADSAFLPVIYEATEEDDWTHPDTWAKANPNLGVSVQLDYLARECEKAKRQPSYENTFKRLHLNLRTGQKERWLRVEDWAACHAEWVPDGPCWGGLDLSTTTDLSAFVLAFLDGETIRLVPHFWIPERKLKDSDRVPYELWAQQGHLTVTPGDVTDYAIIRRDLLAIAERYDLQHVRYDPWNASHLVNELQGDGLQMVQHRQGFASMSGPSKEFERRIIGRTLSHDGNPVLSWMVGNAALAEDAAGNIKPDKKRSSERIDGVTASIMAVAGALTGEASSIYNERGILTL